MTIGMITPPVWILGTLEYADSDTDCAHDHAEQSRDRDGTQTAGDHASEGESRGYNHHEKGHRTKETLQEAHKGAVPAEYDPECEHDESGTCEDEGGRLKGNARGPQATTHREANGS
jgi:hypothetical protein